MLDTRIHNVIAAKAITLWLVKAAFYTIPHLGHLSCEKTLKVLSWPAYVLSDDIGESTMRVLCTMLCD